MRWKEILVQPTADTPQRSDHYPNDDRLLMTTTVALRSFQEKPDVVWKETEAELVYYHL